MEDLVFMLTLLVSSLSFVYNFRSETKKYKKLSEEQATMYYKLHDFVSDNAKFSDSKGKSDSGYDSDEVLEKWNQFHKFHQEFLKLSIKKTDR